nr:MAG TPA: hypothetical protein [Caudoviricetes sp.]
MRLRLKAPEGWHTWVKNLVLLNLANLYLLSRLNDNLRNNTASRQPGFTHELPDNNFRFWTDADMSTQPSTSIWCFMNGQPDWHGFASFL